MDRCVLVIDDNPKMLSMTHNAWAQHRYVQRCMKTGEEAADELRSAYKHDRDYMLLALVADYLDTRLVPMVKLLRCISTLPLLVLSTEYQIQLREEVFLHGADRYLTIPHTIDEGIITGLALMRMCERCQNMGQENDVIMLSDDFYIDQEHYRVFLHGCEIHLTRKEFDLLRYFAQNRKMTLRYESIYERVWGDTYYEDAIQTIWATVKHLRDKLRYVSTDFIRCERYIGYRFDI